jgi:hypothetical protein
MGTKTTCGGVRHHPGPTIMTKPSFALIGAVNHGKSSVAATLAEDDEIGISDVPGQTVVSQRFECRGVGLELWDTPGFQDPRGMLAEIKSAAEAASNPLDVFRDFAGRHEATGAFHAERQMLRPLLDGACILYVIDPSRPPLKSHAAEMELLRLMGLPRLAIINPTASPEHEREWRAKLGQQFGVTHQFNAHKGGGAHRAALLRTMATVVDEWRGELLAAAHKVETEWAARLEDAAQIMVEMLASSVTHARTAAIAPGEYKDEVVQKEKETFLLDLCRHEMAAQAKLRGLFRHQRVAIAGTERLPVGDDLFSEETWKVLGLSWQTLVAGGTLAGGATGAGLGSLLEPLAPTGIATAAGAAIGASFGAVTAVVGGKSVAQPAVVEGGDAGTAKSIVARFRRKTFSAMTGTGTRITVGPLKSGNFPYILLDRAIAVVWYLASRGHAMQEVDHIKPEVLKVRLDDIRASAQHWPDDLKKACREYLKTLAKRGAAAQSAARFRGLLVEHIEAVVGEPFTATPGH